MNELRNREAKRKGLGTLPLVALAALSLITVMVLTYVLVQCWNEYHEVSLFDAGVRDKFDSYRIEAEDLQRLVSLLVAFSSLYAVVLGVSSYISAQGLLERSKENAEHIDRLKTRIEESFPFFQEMGKRMKEVKENLEKLMPDSDTRDDYYDRLDADSRQNIEMVEQSAISWLYFLDFTDANELACEIFRNLGKYYSAKYNRAGKTLKHESGLDSAHSDPAICLCIDARERERRLKTLEEKAGFFLRRAIEKNGKSFLAYNDLAYLLQDIHGDDSIEAERLYRKSIQLEPKQQRAYYDLAIILSYRKEYLEAESLSKKALAHPNWQTQSSSERENDVRYNWACYQDRLARDLPQQKIDQAVQLIEDELRKICTGRDQRRLKMLESDATNGGDLELLASMRPNLLNTLRTILE